MDWFEFVGILATVVPVAAIISLLTAIWFRLLDQQSPSWVVSGYFYRQFARADGDPSVRERKELDHATLRVSNAGRGPAFNIRVRSNPGGKFKTTESFVAAAINPGEHFDWKMGVRHEVGMPGWVEIEWTETRALRKPHRVTRRIARGAWYLEEVDGAGQLSRIQQWTPKRKLED